MLKASASFPLPLALTFSSLIQWSQIHFPSVDVSSAMFSNGGGRGRGGRGGGRGEYYRNKYGRGGCRGGRGRSGGDTGRGNQYEQQRANGGGSMDDLKRCLQRIDGKQYGAYHDLDTPTNRGWENKDAGYTLYVERAQSDSFAAPTRCRVVVRAAAAKFPSEFFANKGRLSDFVCSIPYQRVCTLRYVFAQRIWPFLDSIYII